MRLQGIVESIADPEIDAGRAAQLWAESGCQSLSDPDTTVPTRLVAGVGAVVEQLDAAGARLEDTFGRGGLGVLAERARPALLLRRSGRTSCGGASRLIRAADGWVAVSLARRADRELLPAWLGTDPGAQCVVSDASPWGEVERRAGGRSAAEVVELASLLGLACARVAEVTDRTPFEVDGFGHAGPRPIAGARVVNLASLWAGPLCADVMRRLGADVVCVESVGRPDGARATPAWFDAIHAGQRSFAVDLQSDAGVEQLTRLLTAADVVIEGSRPRALRQLGIDARSLVAAGGPQVWVSITAYGRATEHAMRVGLGDDAAAAGGLVSWIADAPVFVADAIADPLTGLVSAASIIELLTRGERGLVDVSLSRVASCLAPRSEDPRVSPLGVANPARAWRTPGTRFVLGADTDDVCQEWGLASR